MEQKRGFTLIELLVVISIISFLSSVVLSSVNQSRVKANQVRDSEIVQQYVTSLQRYYLDNNQYPNTGIIRQYCLGNATDGNCGFDSAASVDNTINTQFATYYPNLPVGQKLEWFFGINWEGPIYQCHAIVNGKCLWGAVYNLIKGNSRQLCANAKNVWNYQGGYWMCEYHFGEASVYNGNGFRED
jgi:prepilin-type N-terminal cleavage/methylation domain-containing protein